MPILHFPGEMIPGQLGPIRRLLDREISVMTRTMSSVGMPSVMQTISATLGSRRFHNGIRGKGGRNKDDRCIDAFFLNGFLDGVEDRDAFVSGSPFAGSDARHHFCAIGFALLGVERTLFARNALNCQTSVFID